MTIIIVMMAIDAIVAILWMSSGIYSANEYKRFREKPRALRSRRRTAWKWIVTIFFYAELGIYRLTGWRMPMVRRHFAKRAWALQMRLNAEHGTEIIYPL